MKSLTFEDLIIHMKDNHTKSLWISTQQGEIRRIKVTSLEWYPLGLGYKSCYSSEYGYTKFELCDLYRTKPQLK